MMSRIVSAYSDLLRLLTWTWSSGTWSSGMPEGSAQLAGFAPSAPDAGLRIRGPERRRLPAW